MKEHYDVIILGAGAAGMMCAAEAGKRGRSVLVLDHAPKVGSKILLSGGPELALRLENEGYEWIKSSEAV